MRLIVFKIMQVLVSIFCLVVITNGQQVIQQTNTFRFYNVKDGFPGGMTFATMMDKHGNLWISSSNGLFRFDGYDFEKLSDRSDLGNGYFPEIGKYNNDIVISSRSSLIFYDDTKDIFTSIPYPEKVESDMMTSFYEVKGELFIFNLTGPAGPGNRGNYHLKFDPVNKTFTKLPDLGPRQVIMNTLKSPNLCLIDYNGNILEQQQNGSFRIITKIAGDLPVVVSIDNKNWIVFDRDQKCFLKISKKDSNYFREKITSWSGELYQTKKTSLLLEDGSIVFISGHDSKSVYKLKDNKIEEIFTATDPLYTLLVDQERNYWMGGIKGIYKIYNDRFQQLKFVEKNPPFISRILADKNGQINFSVYQKGIYQLDQQNDKEQPDYFTGYTQVKEFSDGFTPAGIRLSNNKLLFGTAPGFITGSNFNWKHIDMNYQVLLDVMEKNDSSGVYLATNYGLKEWTESNGVRRVNVSKEIKDVKVQSLYKDKQKKNWILYDNQIGAIKNGTVIRDTTFSRYKVIKIAQDFKDNYWVSTPKGLFIYSKAKWIEPLPYLFKQGPGNMLITRNELLVMTSNSSLYIIDLKKYYSQDKLECNTYNLSNGFPVDDINRNCFFEDSAGRLWINGLNQLFFCYPEKLTAIQSFITPKVKYLTTNRQEFTYRDILFAQNNVIELSRGDNKLSYTYSAISLSNPGFAFFRYRLKGLSDKWSEPTKETKATFNNLEPGDYQFEVSASFDGVNWSDPATTPSVTIRPYWYQTILFKAILITILIIFLYALHRMRLNHALKLERLRKNISSDLHDEIGSTLSSINIYAGLAKKGLDKNSHLDSITQNINQVVNKLDDLVWSINPKYDSLLNIVSRLYSYAEPLAKAKEILFKIENNFPQADIKLSAEVKHNIYLTAKELVNNAVKHSECKNIWVHFYKHSGNFNLSVSDDGIGFDKNTIRNDRNGLSNIVQRVSVMKGTLATETGNGHGTKTTISIPLG